MANTRNQNLCPHCGSKVLIRHSQVENPLLKTLYGQCMNLNCGWTGRAHMEWAATISPSATPNPEIDLPLSAIAISKNSSKHDIQNRGR
jgi:predicted RNA-binding Zn-ribbon protein involved in translation (DUF1610 family)